MARPAGVCVLACVCVCVCVCSASVQFAYDNVGSESDGCSEMWRGPSAFSEPETRAQLLGDDEHHNRRL